MARILKTLTLAGIAYALWQYLKSVLEEPEADPVASAPYGAPAAPPAATPAPAATEGAGAPEKPAATASSNGGGSSRSKAELYEEAQRLGIEGRSKMSKAELERAIRDAG